MTLVEDDPNAEGHKRTVVYDGFDEAFNEGMKSYERFGLRTIVAEAPAHPSIAAN